MIHAMTPQKNLTSLPPALKHSPSSSPTQKIFSIDLRSLGKWLIDKICHVWKWLSEHFGIQCVFGKPQKVKSYKEASVQTIAELPPPSPKKESSNVDSSLRVSIEKNQMTISPPESPLNENGIVRHLRDASQAFERKKTDFDQKKMMFLQMVHDIRSLAHNIAFSIDSLSEGGQLSEDQQKNIDILKEASNTLTGFIDDSLLLSSFEANKVKLSNSHFSLSHCFKQIQKTFEEKCQEKNITLQFSPLPKKLPKWIFADKTKVLRVVMNLVSNAIKYNQHNGKVVVTVKFDEAAQGKMRSRKDSKSIPLIIEITDTGYGLSKEDQEKLFQPYSRSPGTSHIQGTGLGLVVSRLLAQIMQGNITLVSEVGKGSTFSFSFIAEKGKKPVSLRLTPRDSSLQRKDVRILVAEDNKTNQKFIDKLLKKLGFANFELVGNGVEALKALKEKHFDVVLMDLQMPEMYGDVATAAFRQWEKETGNTQRTPIIAATAGADDEVAQRCKKAGMDSFLYKPYTEKGLELAILEQLKR